MLWNKEYYKQSVYVLKGLQVPKFLVSPEDEGCGPDCACKKTPGEKAPALDTTMITPNNQDGKGCLSDQLLGQYLAHTVGLGYVLDPAHVRTASRSIFNGQFQKEHGRIRECPASLCAE